MDYKEACEWLKGNRSTVNTIPHDPLETWQIRTAQADAAMTQQAYWIVKAYNEARAFSTPQSVNITTGD